MKKVFYIGDWAVQLGPIFAETSFNHVPKGLDIFNYGRWLKDALESTELYDVTSIPTWEFYKMAPGDYEKILETYDVIIFSDVEAKNFQLSPDFFDRKNFGKEPLTFPDRVRLTVEAVQGGMNVMFLGGWLSFNGEMGKGGWGRTQLKEILPVECMEYEDLRESTEGFIAGPINPNHAFFAGIELSTMPPILGYNRVKPRKDCPVLATWDETDDPAIAYGDFGQGRVFAYTSDPAPHWGCNFIYWDGYTRFWLNALELVLRRDHS